MAETIRDLIIKIRLQQEKSKLEPPDTSAYRDAVQRASKPSTGGGTATAEEKQYDAEAKEALAAYSRIMREREKQAEEAMRLAERTAAYVDNIDATAGQRIVNRAQRNAVARAQADAQMLAASKATLESFSAIGEGALRAARGVAFLTAANEEDLRAAMQYVAAAQGVLDVYAGLAGATKGLLTLRTAETTVNLAAASAEGTRAGVTALGTAADAASVPVKVARVGATRAETAALAMQTTAQGVSTAGTVLATAATTAQAAATWALNAALAANPVTLALVAAGLAAAGAAYVLTRRESEATTEAIDENIKAFERLAEQSRRGAEALSMVGQEFDVAMQQIEARGQGASTDPEEQMQKFRQQAEAQKAYLRNLFDRGDPAVGVGVIGAAKVQLEIDRTEEATLQKQLSLREKMTSELERQKRIAEQALDTAKRTVEAERQKLQSKEEAIGRLNPGERQRLAGIAGRLGKGGELTEAEARFLDRTGLGKDQTSAFYRRRGQEAGASGILGQLGETAAFDQAKRDLTAASATYKPFVDEARQILEKYQQEQRKDWEEIAQLFGEVLNQKAFIERIEAEQQKQTKAITATQLNKP